MKNILKGVLIYLLAVLTIAGIMLISDMNKPTPQAAVPCEFCEGACTVSHKVACKTAHNAPNYYYYTYKCTQCGYEFTVEFVKEKFQKTY